MSRRGCSTLRGDVGRRLSDDFLTEGGRRRRGRIVRGLVSSVTRRALAPVSGLGVCNRVLSRAGRRGRRRVTAVLRRARGLSFLVRSLIGLSQVRDKVVTMRSRSAAVARVLRSVRRRFGMGMERGGVALDLYSASLRILYSPG